MVTTVTAYTDTRNRALPGTGFDGVVRVSVGGHYGTGALLYDGRAILTAAHLFANVGAASTSILFETSAGSQTLAVSEVKVLSTYDATQTNDDLALVWLSGSAPLSAERYSLYRSSDEIAQTLTMVGYGLPGTGLSGTLNSYSGSPLRLKATNQFDADASTLKSELGSVMGWTPTAGSQLIADFDNGTTAQDALGRLINRPGTGLGQDEGLVAPGDSGGPAFINGQLAGVASYTASLGYSSINPDIDTTTNSSYGEIAAWQRVSYYQQWIDQSVRAHYPNAPTKPADVQKAVNEGSSGSITNAYFLLQFTGVRSDPKQKLSVDFSTRNGTATAGQDYIPVKGTLVIYPNESQAVIPVEVIGDSAAEADEFFYLDVTNPVGGSFGDGVITLTAIRTIVNDDGSV
jgi:hypothetical protein